MSKTFSMIKPDACKNGHALDILTMISNAGFQIVKLEYRSLTSDEIDELYQEHKEKSFFGEIRDFIASHPVALLVLEREDAVAKLRELMGATRSADAVEGTIRHAFGNKTDIMLNAIHGSDSDASAAREMSIFF